MTVAERSLEEARHRIGLCGVAPAYFGLESSKGKLLTAISEECLGGLALSARIPISTLLL